MGLSMLVNILTLSKRVTNGQQLRRKGGMFISAQQQR